MLAGAAASSRTRRGRATNKHARARSWSRLAQFVTMSILKAAPLFRLSRPPARVLRRSARSRASTRDRPATEHRSITEEKEKRKTAMAGTDEASQILARDFSDVWEQLLDERGSPSLDRMKAWWFEVQGSAAPFGTVERGAERILDLLERQRYLALQSYQRSYPRFAGELEARIAQERFEEEREREALRGYRQAAAKRQRVTPPTPAVPVEDPADVLARIERAFEEDDEPAEDPELIGTLNVWADRYGIEHAYVDVYTLYHLVGHALRQTLEEQGRAPPSEARPAIRGRYEAARPQARVVAPAPAPGRASESAALLAELEEYRGRVRSLEEEVRRLREQAAGAPRPVSPRVATPFPYEVPPARTNLTPPVSPTRPTPAPVSRPVVRAPSPRREEVPPPRPQPQAQPLSGYQSRRRTQVVAEKPQPTHLPPVSGAIQNVQLSYLEALGAGPRPTQPTPSAPPAQPGAQLTRRRPTFSALATPQQRPTAGGRKRSFASTQPGAGQGP